MKPQKLQEIKHDESTTREQLIEEVASLRDQVNRLEARQERNKEQVTAEMRRAFKDAPVGLCFFDAELRYVQINDFLAEINGLPPEEHIGKPISEVLAGIAAAGAEKELRGVVESGDPVIRGSVTAESPAYPGEKHTYMHDYHPIRSSDGEVVGVGCCVLDITDLRRAEQERDRRAREVIGIEREVNELWARFGGARAHK